MKSFRNLKNKSQRRNFVVQINQLHLHSRFSLLLNVQFLALRLMGQSFSKLRLYFINYCQQWIAISAVYSGDLQSLYEIRFDSFGAEVDICLKFRVDETYFQSFITLTLLEQSLVGTKMSRVRESERFSFCFCEDWLNLR